MTNNFDEWAARLAAWVVRRPWLTIVVSVLAVAAVASGMRHLTISNNYRIFFSEANPELSAFEEFQTTYSKTDNILFVLQSASGKAFTPQMAEAVETLTERAWRIPYALRVDSVSNFQHSWAAGDDIRVDRLYRNGGELTHTELNEKEAIALAEPLLRGNLISTDGATTGINVTLQYPGESIAEVPETARAAREIRDAIVAQYPDLTVAITGIAMLNNAFAEASQTDMATLVPLMYLVLSLVIVVTLRSVAASLCTLSVIVLAILAAMGFAGFSGIAMTPISFAAPTVIMTLAVSDCIHLFVSMFRAMREGLSKTAAIVESVRVNFMPVAVTSLTTAAGFLSLNFSDSPPFWHLGNISAVGIATAGVLSVTFLPAFVSLVPLKPRAARQSVLEARLDDLAVWVIAHSGKILLGFGAIAIALIAQVPKLELSDDFIRFFDERIEFRTDSEFAIDNLNGVYVIEYSLQAAGPAGISEPEYLTELEAFTTWLREQPEVRHVFSYSDIVKRLNRNMHGDDPAHYRIPDKRPMAAQLLFLYENSLPAGNDLTDRIDLERSATRVTVAIDDMTSREGIAFFERSSRWLQSNAPSYMWTAPTSVSVLFSYISQRNVEKMLSGNVTAVLVIGLVLILALRSVALGALSLVPNAIPVLATFGLWSLLVGTVGMAAAMITATSLGIVVDDTVHFLSKYLRARREKQLDRPEAIRYAVQSVGVAIIVTSMVLTLGFGALTFSSFLINSQMGLLTSMTILFALVFDLLVLPALLLIGYQRKEDVAHETQFSS